jgi:hypothetical protein
VGGEVLGAAVGLDLDDAPGDDALVGPPPEDEPEQIGRELERRTAKEAQRRRRAEGAATATWSVERGRAQRAVAIPTCIRKPMSPWTFILPVMKASWAFMRPSWMAM